MPRGIVFIGNETWRLNAVSNRKTRRTLARELDKLHKLIKTEAAVYLPDDVLRRIEIELGEFGDLLLDANIRYGEVL